MVKKLTTKEILDIQLYNTDLNDVTIRTYLYELLKELWEQEESFSGKKPFGNGGWKHDIYKGLVGAGAVKGNLDSEGDIISFDEPAADKIISKLIYQLFESTK